MEQLRSTDNWVCKNDKLCLRMVFLPILVRRHTIGKEKIPVEAGSGFQADIKSDLINGRVRLTQLLGGFFQTHVPQILTETSAWRRWSKDVPNL